jgi:hypothetical protein
MESRVSRQADGQGSATSATRRAYPTFGDDESWPGAVVSSVLRDEGEDCLHPSRTTRARRVDRE